VKSVEWDRAIPALPANAGYKLRGEVTLDEGSKVPVYLHLKGNAHLSAESRRVCPEDKLSCLEEEKHIADWNDQTEWTVLDYRSADAMSTRMSEGRMTPLDTILLVFTAGLALGFFGLIYYYVRGLMGAPRELYLLYFTKVTEYSAYGAAAFIMVPFL
jgi:hypothetical protein